MISRPPGHFDALELRLLPITYAERELGGNEAPRLQFVRVTLDGQLVADLPLSGDGWHTYRLALLPDDAGTAAFLKLDASHTARPVDFAPGQTRDDRELGVAVDYVRFTTLASSPAAR
jgi:hypothetical protein